MHTGEITFKPQIQQSSNVSAFVALEIWKKFTFNEGIKRKSYL